MASVMFFFGVPRFIPQLSNIDVFAKMLKTKPFDEFKSLILGKCQNIRHFVKSTFSVNKSITVTIDIIQRDRLHLLFGRVFNVKSIDISIESVGKS
jgi:hypothetical protein